MLKPQDSSDGEGTSMRSRRSTRSSCISRDEAYGRPETPSGSSGNRSGAAATREYQERPVNLMEFLELYKAFTMRMRKDLRDLFNEYSTPGTGATTPGKVSPRPAPLNEIQRGQSVDSPSLAAGALLTLSVPIPPENLLPEGAVTRNVTPCNLPEKQHKIYNALALASVPHNAAMDTSRTAWLTAASLKQFIVNNQMEAVDENECIRLIQEHEPDLLMRSRNQMSFDGFTRYLQDARNFAFVPEDMNVNMEEMQYPLSYYYVSSSHNTYLTGHQLKGESRAELYRQVLLTGCRCVELDCWDGDDGYPVIYHGHTFTSKISFRQAVDIIKKSAFLTSSLPVILSIENHCSILQQTRMAAIFKNTFGDKLVSQFMFSSDFSDIPHLPAPIQLQYKILIKNKKLIVEPSQFPPFSTDKQKDSASCSSPQPLSRKYSKNSFASSTGDTDEDEDFDDLDDLPDEDDDATENISIRSRVLTGSPVPSRDCSGSKRTLRRPPTLAGIGPQDSVSSDNASISGIKSEEIFSRNSSKISYALKIVQEETMQRIISFIFSIMNSGAE